MFHILAKFKRQFVAMISLFLLFGFPTIALADQYVNGYYRSNGTYVNGYYRSSPDGNPYNNYSYPGNYNPYTGVTAGGNSDTYLNNYYSKSYSTSYPSYTASYPSYDISTPSCPLNSYYDSLSSSCKCNYGYVVSGSSCISGSSYCWSSYGYGSEYDSLDKSCKCSSGYRFNEAGTECVTNLRYCMDKYGFGAENDYPSGCKCSSGYTFDGRSKCVYKSLSSYPSTYSSVSECPANASAIGSKCYCNDGFELNSTKDGCVAAVTCPEGYVKKNGLCITYTQDCKNSFGENVIGIAGNNGNSSCYCESGFEWNSDKRFCIKSSINSFVTSEEKTESPRFTKFMKVGEKNTQVELLQKLLISYGYLTAKPTGYFGTQTKVALKKLQKNNGLSASGEVDQRTLDVINKLTF